MLPEGIIVGADGEGPKQRTKKIGHKGEEKFTLCVAKGEGKGSLDLLLQKPAGDDGKSTRKLCKFGYYRVVGKGCLIHEKNKGRRKTGLSMCNYMETER